ncbi:MAG: META domain-containing protein [Rikenellaceae bacterium]|nr:META domain-containing protein [Rikenellaceae bacterium]
MKRFLFAMIAAAAVVACSTEQPTTLENTEWKLVELRGENNEKFATEPDSFFFTLTEENGLTGVGACNRFFGNYRLGGLDTLELEPMGMTQMACPNMELEDEFVKMLHEVNTYSIEGNRLVLFNEGEKVAEMEAVAEQK